MGKQATPEYEALMDAANASLPDGTLWCIINQETGEVVPGTAHDRPDEAIVVFCSAMGCDWDDAKEIGFHLGQCMLKH